MSKTVAIELTCPRCGKQWDEMVYRTIWVEFPENMKLILSDQINVVTCQACGFSERLPFAFMATNVEKRIAIWFEPYPDPHVDSDVSLYRKHYGEDYFYAKAPRVREWEEFKTRLVQMNSQPNVSAKIQDLTRLKKGMSSSHTEMLGLSSKRARETEAKFAELVDTLRVKGHGIPKCISDIPNFPSQTFAGFEASVRNGDLVLYRPGLKYNSDVFTLMANRVESQLFYAGTLAMWVGPFVGLLLAILFSWLWILTAPVLFFLGWKLGRSIYASTIFRNALVSELRFCFLFYGSYVGVGEPGLQKVFTAGQS